MKQIDLIKSKEHRELFFEIFKNLEIVEDEYFIERYYILINRYLTKYNIINYY